MRAEASRSGQYLKSSHRCKGELGWKDGDDWKEKGQQKQDHGLKQGGGEHLLVMKWENKRGGGTSSGVGDLRQAGFHHSQCLTNQGRAAGQGKLLTFSLKPATEKVMVEQPKNSTVVF